MDLSLIIQTIADFEIKSFELLTVTNTVNNTNPSDYLITEIPTINKTLPLNAKML